MQDSANKEERRRMLRRNSDQFQDEISLQDLYLVLVKRKMTIILTVAVCLVASILYVVFATKIYQASARIIIPTEDDLVLSKQLKEKLEPKQIFSEFQTLFLQDGTWNDFAEQHKNWFKTEQDSDSKDSVKSNPVELGKDKDFVGEHVLVKYDSGDIKDINPILEQYIEFAKQNYIAHLISARERRIAREIDLLKQDIDQARRLEMLKRQDEMALIESNLAIAKKLNITDNRQFTMKEQSKLTVVASNMNVPMYMRGTKVLAAELESLKNRTSGDAFIPGLREKQQKLENLQAIKFDAKQFSPFILDGTIQKAKKIKPKSRLIVALGLVLGIFLGLFMAFVVEFVQKTRYSQAGESASNP